MMGYTYKSSPADAELVSLPLCECVEEKPGSRGVDALLGELAGQASADGVARGLGREGVEIEVGERGLLERDVDGGRAEEYGFLHVGRGEGCESPDEE